MSDLNRLLALAVLMGFFACLALVLWRMDRDSKWGNAHIAQLVLNAHGEFDVPKVALWASFVFSVWAISYSLFKGALPDGLPGMYAAFQATVVAPVVADRWRAKPPDRRPPVLPKKNG